ncbi:MAG: LLM class flavin-dependent oxidoreductase [Actinobacteria bacterium]|nr:LLM class flavin-dependent oxidoreductase [Actinomycetota bacterium]
MPIELRAWLNPQSYSNSYSTAGLAREAAYFTPVPEPVTADPGYISAEAREYEAAGYDSAIWPQSATWPDVTVTATWALARTERLRVVLAHRPGTQAPTAAARALATLDRVSAGRTGLHLILGSGADLPRDGDHADRDARYRRAAEYLEIFTGVLGRDQPFDFDGEFYRVRGAYSGVKPVQTPRPPISLPAESDDGIALAARYADVLAFHGTARAAAAAKIATARALAGERDLRFWINLNMVAGETDEAARQHVRELEQAIRTLQEFRSGGQVKVRSIREDRFADLDSGAGPWQDEALYLGLTALSRATPALVGSPSTIADAVLAYHDLGIGVVSLGSHVTSAAAAELRRETLRLIRQAVTVRDAAPKRAA